MKRTLLIILFFLTAQQVLVAQEHDKLVARLILIGDAGEMDPQQRAVIKHAAGKIIQGKTTVMFLGDNIYPEGMALDAEAAKKTKEILKSQFKPMRDAGAAVYILPGNHDWDKSGPNGLAKIKAQGKYVLEQNDSLLKMVPQNGCPDPIAISINKDCTVIAFDSEWWLFPYNKAEDSCSCHSEAEAINRFRHILAENEGKIIILASHHPFRSYGNHGGYFSLKQHLFPLTAINTNFYLPLPVIGSLVVLGKNVFRTAEDLKHPVYRSMITQIDSVFKDQRNVIHVAGHEHGLQFVKDDLYFQVISGAGAKHSFVVNGKHALYTHPSQGYVIADLDEDKNITFTYYAEKDAGVIETFKYVKRYIR